MGARTRKIAHSRDYRNIAIQAARTLMRMRNASGGGTATSSRNNRRNFNSTGISTSHYDRKLKYRYKRMPAKKRKRYVKRVRFVKHAISKDLARFKVTYSTSTNVNAIAGQQAIFASFSAFGIPDTVASIQAAGNFNQTINAWQQMVQQADAVSAASLYGKKWKQLSSLCNLEITNYGSTTVIMDVYRVVCRKTFCNSDYQTPETDNSNSETVLMEKMSTNMGGSVSSDWSTIGVTPFAINAFTKHFKILQVKEVQIPAGDTTTLSYRDPKNYTFNMSSFLGKVFIKGLTKGYVFRFRGVPATAGGTSAAVSIGVHQEYGNVVQEFQPNADINYHGNIA